MFLFFAKIIHTQEILYLKSFVFNDLWKSMPAEILDLLAHENIYQSRVELLKWKKTKWNFPNHNDVLTCSQMLLIKKAFSSPYRHPSLYLVPNAQSNFLFTAFYIFTFKTIYRDNNMNCQSITNYWFFCVSVVFKVLIWFPLQTRNSLRITENRMIHQIRPNARRWNWFDKKFLQSRFFGEMRLLSSGGRYRQHQKFLKNENSRIFVDFSESLQQLFTIWVFRSNEALTAVAKS